MANEETRVRDVAHELNEAILAARGAGYRVDWPLSSDGLATIAVSAGRKALTPDEIGALAKAQAQREQDERNALDEQNAAAIRPTSARLNDMPGNSL